MPLEHRVVRESQAVELEMTEAQARGLADLGRRLAGKQAWWGSPRPGERRSTSAIAVQPTARRGRWRVRVNDAVGAVSVGELHLTVRPKIPEEHFLGLLSRAGAVPRLDRSSALHPRGTDLWELLANWYLAAVEDVLRADLARDYRSARAERPHVAGRVDFVRTAMNFGRGRLAVAAEAQEYDFDNPLNRVLLAASRLVQSSPVLPGEARRRAGRVTSRFPDVSPLVAGDLDRAGLERRTTYYGSALRLARQLISGAALGLGEGGTPGWAFLIRTPEPVEEGLRRLLGDGLTDHHVAKRGLRLRGSMKTLNPDLVFDERTAVGDVKYKVTGEAWRNDDLYQLVAFAAGYRARRGLLVSFSPLGRRLPTLEVGDIEVSNVTWHATPEKDFDRAASDWVAGVRGWIDGMVAPSDE